MTAPQLAAVASVEQGEQEDAVVVRSLGFAFPFSQASVIRDLDLQLPRGSRCLLTGANGAGERPVGSGGSWRRVMPAQQFFHLSESPSVANNNRAPSAATLLSSVRACLALH